jgi:hypothetical protein
MNTFAALMTLRDPGRVGRQSIFPNMRLNIFVFFGQPTKSRFRRAVSPNHATEPIVLIPLLWRNHTGLAIARAVNPAPQATVLAVHVRALLAHFTIPPRSCRFSM